MSQTQQQLPAASVKVSQPDGESESSVCDQNQLVPVTESIKYRRRAQTAEQKVEQLTKQLQDREQEQKDVQSQLKETTLENELTQKLVQAGVADIEVGLLLAKDKMKGPGDEPKDIRTLIDTLRKEKPYLFSNMVDEVTATLAGPTAGVRGQRTGSINNLSRLAQQAQRSGSRKDMQEYLRQRRSVRSLH